MASGVGCVIIVGHGAAPHDCPPEILREWRQLSQEPGKGSSARFLELDTRLRAWPRNPDNDPYRAGVEEIARALGRQLPGRRVLTAYNELCAPALEDAVAQAAAAGAKEITVIPTMYTRGGMHSEKEIPEHIRALRRRHPEVVLRYAWPLDVDEIGKFLCREVLRAEKEKAPAL